MTLPSRPNAWGSSDASIYTLAARAYRDETCAVAPTVKAQH